ncbi:MAG: Ni/Fe hydrogenase subunit alpha [bacterium]
MHKDQDITIEGITKIEGHAELKVKVEDGKVTDLKFIIDDYRRFYTEAVRGKYYMSVPSTLSRICGTCSTAHLLASIEATERAFGIHDKITEQTRLIRRLTMNGTILRDHALHLYIFSLPDVLKIDSVIDIPDEDCPEHELLHDGFDLKALGNRLASVFSGAAIHAPFPTIGGFLKIPMDADLPKLIDELEAGRVKALRGIDVFAKWEAYLERNSDYMSLSSETLNFLEGRISINNKDFYDELKFMDFLEEVVIPYSQAKGYKLKGANEDYLVGALARINLNKDKINSRTIQDTKDYLSKFPSNNVYHNCLAQAIEMLHCIDDSIDILKSLKLVDEKPIEFSPIKGSGVGVIEAPRGILYHKIETDEKGLVTFSDVIVPTSQNVINIENDLRKLIQDNLERLETEELKHEAEKLIRAYDPCMSCTTNFLKINVERL